MVHPRIATLFELVTFGCWAVEGGEKCDVWRLSETGQMIVTVSHRCSPGVTPALLNSDHITASCLISASTPEEGTIFEVLEDCC